MTDRRVERGGSGAGKCGRPGEFSIEEPRKREMAEVGSDSKIVNEPLPADDPTRRKPDISLAKEELGWEPSIPLEEGLKHAIAYFKTVI